MDKSYDVFPIILCKEGDKVEIENLDGGYQNKSKMYMAGLVPGKHIEIVTKFASSGALNIQISTPRGPVKKFLGASAAELLLVRKI